MLRNLLTTVQLVKPNIRAYATHFGIREKTNTVFNIVPQGMIGVVERFGKFLGTKDPGWFLAIPVIDRVRLVNVREVPTLIAPQTGVTLDNVMVSCSGSLFVQPTDPHKLCYGSTDPYWSIEEQARSAMRTAIGKITLDRLFQTRGDLNNEIYKALTATDTDWGLRATRYEITEITVDKHISDAMNSQAIAERKRRESVLNSQAQRESDINISEGKKIAMINAAEGEKQRDILNAEGERQKAILLAEGERQRSILVAQGEAEAYERLAKVIETPEGQQTVQLRLAQDYMANLSKGLGTSSNVYIPQDITDVNKVMSQAMTLYHGLAKKTDRKDVKDD